MAATAFCTTSCAPSLPTSALDRDPNLATHAAMVAREIRDLRGEAEVSKLSVAEAGGWSSVAAFSAKDARLAGAKTSSGGR